MAKYPTDDVGVNNGGARNIWLRNAPSALISLHSKTGNGRAVLARLLQDPRMGRAWIEIDKRVKERGLGSPIVYQRLWGAIGSALSQANSNSKPSEKARSSLDRKTGKRASILPHDERKKRNLKIARIASQLSEHLLDGPLDLYAYEFLPDDVARLAVGVKSLGAQIDRTELSDFAYLQVLKWTTLRELLHELERKAHAEARKPPVVAKMTREFRSNYFIRTLAPYFKYHFGGTMEATLAIIANVILERGEADRLTYLDVKRALRHEGGDKTAK